MQWIFSLTATYLRFAKYLSVYSGKIIAQIQDVQCTCTLTYLYRQYYTLVEQKAILLIFISIIDKDINLYSKWSWQKNQFELIKISIDSSIYGCILHMYVFRDWEKYQLITFSIN